MMLTVLVIFTLSFRLVLSDLEMGLKTLQPQEYGSLNLVPENPFTDVKYSVRQAEAIILFSLNALAEIANTKSNLIGVIFCIFTNSIILICHRTYINPTTLEYCIMQKNNSNTVVIVVCVHTFTRLRLKSVSIYVFAGYIFYLRRVSKLALWEGHDFFFLNANFELE